MIGALGLVRLGFSREHHCSHRWESNARRGCPATGTTHFCVGDSGHGGKHVCPCGALRTT